MSKAVVPYVISDLVANMPVHVLSSGTFTVILYFMSGLRKDDLGANLFIFVADNVLVQLVRPTWPSFSSSSSFSHHALNLSSP